MTASPVAFSCAQGIAHIRLTNPDAGNVFNLTMIAALTHAIASIDPATARAVLITAEGRNFSIGGDINGMQAASDKARLLEEMAEQLHSGLKALDILGLPVVTAVNGAAAGAGLSLAIAGDVVVGAASSSYLMAYSGIGLSPDGGATYHLPRLIGMRLTQEMAYLNRRLTADEAHCAGLITRVVADEALETEAETVAQALASGPTVAYRKIKSLLSQGYGSSLTSQLDREALSITATARSRDAAVGVEAFLRRQTPLFQGK